MVLAKDEHEGWMLNSYEWVHRRFPKIVDCRPIMVESQWRQPVFGLSI